MPQFPRRGTAHTPYSPVQFANRLVDWINDALRPGDETRERVILTAAESLARRDADMIAALARLGRVAASDPPHARSILSAFFLALIRTKALVARMPIEPRRGHPQEWSDSSLSDLNDLVADVKGKERSRQTGNRIKSDSEAIIYLLQSVERTNNRPLTRYKRLEPKAKTMANRLSSYRKRKKAHLKNPGNSSE